MYDTAISCILIKLYTDVDFKHLLQKRNNYSRSHDAVEGWIGKMHMRCRYNLTTKTKKTSQYYKQKKPNKNHEIPKFPKVSEKNWWNYSRKHLNSTCCSFKLWSSIVYLTSLIHKIQEIYTCCSHTHTFNTYRLFHLSLY